MFAFFAVVAANQKRRLDADGFVHAGLVNPEVTKTAHVYLEPMGYGRCSSGTGGMMRNAAQCKANLQMLGYKVKDEEKVQAWGKVCGCAFNKATGKMQFNKFKHPHYCYPFTDSKGPRIRHMMAQNANSWTGYQAVCMMFEPVEPKPAAYFFAEAGAARCPVPEGKGMANNYGTVWTPAECKAAIQLLGKEVHQVTNVKDGKGSWGKVCGCSYNAETGLMQWNQFLHPEYCWNYKFAKQHMDAQAKDAKENNLRPVCRPTPLTADLM